LVALFSKRFARDANESSYATGLKGLGSCSGHARAGGYIIIVLQARQVWIANATVGK